MASSLAQVNAQIAALAQAATALRGGISGLDVGGVVFPLEGLCGALSPGTPASLTVTVGSGGTPVTRALPGVCSQTAPTTREGVPPRTPVHTLTAGSPPVTLDLSPALAYALAKDQPVTVSLTANGGTQSTTLTRAVAYAKAPKLAVGCPATPPRPRVRYLRIELVSQTVTDFLNVAGLEAWNGNSRSVAVTGTSSAPNVPANSWENANDGNPDTFFHSGGSAPIFLELDFGAGGVPCTEVRVINRKDCCQNRLAVYRLLAKDPGGIVLLTKNLTANAEQRFPL